MKIEVQHINRDTQTGDSLGFSSVAIVEVSDNVSVIEALEHAFRWTQNLMDSWSLNMTNDGHPDVTPMNMRDDGMGHRSTSMFDQMIVNGQTHTVGLFGFEKV